jgi:hypothetical protein
MAFDRDKDLPAALVIAAGAVLIAVAIVVGGPEPDVAYGQFLKGVFVAAVAGWAVPASAYYALFRFVPNKIVCVVLSALSIIPLGYYLLVVLLITAGFTGCPPDAHECPV